MARYHEVGNIIEESWNLKSQSCIWGMNTHEKTLQFSNSSEMKFNFYLSANIEVYTE